MSKPSLEKASVALASHYKALQSAYKSKNAKARVIEEQHSISIHRIYLQIKSGAFASEGKSANEAAEKLLRLMHDHGFLYAHTHLLRCAFAKAYLVVVDATGNRMLPVAEIKRMISLLSSGKSKRFFVRHSIIACCGALFASKGIEVASQIGSLWQVFAKLLKSSSTRACVRVGLYRCIATVLQGCGPSASFIHEPCIRAISKYLPNERYAWVRAAGSEALAHLCHNLSPWSHELAEQLMRLCIRMLGYHEASIREPIGRALGWTLYRRVTEKVSLSNANRGSPSQNSSRKNDQDTGLARRSWTVLEAVNLLTKILLHPPEITTSSLGATSALFALSSTLSGNTSSSGNSGVGGVTEQRATTTHALVTFLKEIPAKLIMDELEGILQSLISPLVHLKELGSADAVLQLSACAGFIIRHGLTDRCNENHQLSLLRAFVSLLSVKNKKNSKGVSITTTNGKNEKNNAINEYIAIVMVRELAHIIHVLGEVCEQSFKELDQCVTELLQHASFPVRRWAAVCARSLGNAVPHRLATMVRQYLQFTTMQCAELETNEGARRECLYAVQGLSQAVGALLAATGSGAAALGVPNNLHTFAYKVAITLLAPTLNGSTLTASGSNVPSLVARAEAGWSILDACVLHLGSRSVEARLSTLLHLWRGALESVVKLPARPEPRQLVTFARPCAAALSALRSFLRTSRALLSAALLEHVVHWLKQCLSVVQQHGAPAGATSQGAAAAAQTSAVRDAMANLRDALFRCFAELPVASYASAHVPLIRFLVAHVVEGPAGSALAAQVDDEDHCLCTFRADAGQYAGISGAFAFASGEDQVVYSSGSSSHSSDSSGNGSSGGGSGSSGGGNASLSYGERNEYAEDELRTWYDLWLCADGHEDDSLSAQRLLTCAPPLIWYDASLLWRAERVTGLLHPLRPPLPGAERQAVDSAAMLLPALLLAQPPKNQQSALRHFGACIKAAKNHRSRLGALTANLLSMFLSLLQAHSDAQSGFGAGGVSGMAGLDWSAGTSGQNTLSSSSSAVAAGVGGGGGNIDTASGLFVPNMVAPAAVRAFVGKATTAFAPQILSLVFALLGSGIRSPLLRIGAADVVGRLTCIVGTQQCHRLLSEELYASAQSRQRAALALSLGSLHRAVGGMRAQSFLHQSVELLLQLISDRTPEVHAWGLHSLWLVINAAGSPFASKAASMIGSMHDLISVSDAYGVLLPLQGIGRVMIASMSALGPELTAGQRTFSYCGHVAELLEEHNIADIRLESLQYHQMRILFAPQTVHLDKMVNVFESVLQSSTLSLRTAGVVGLHQLAQVNIRVLSEKKIEEKLFHLYDSEHDEQLRQKLYILLNTLADLSAANAPMKWMRLCHGVLTSGNASSLGTTSGSPVFAAAAAASVATAPPSSGVGDGDSDSSDEDENDEAAEEARSQSLTGDASGANAVERFKPRYATKVMAVKLLECVIMAVAAQVEHTDLVVARASDNPGDKLVTQLSSLIALACKTVSARAAPLRTAGIQLLQRVVEVFGATQDPDALPEDEDLESTFQAGPLLLEQFQVQIGSALKSAFAESTPPPVTTAGCHTLVTYVLALRSRATAVNRVLSLLESPLDHLRSLDSQQYGRQAVSLVQLAVLHAAAALLNHCDPTSSASNQKDAIWTWLKPRLPSLRAHWVAALRDYAVLTTQTPDVCRTYAGVFSSFAASSAMSITSLCYQQSWSIWAVAVSSLVRTPAWRYGREESTSAVATSSGEKEEKEASPDSEKAEAALFRESTALEDANLLVGLALGYLCGPCDGEQAVHCLTALKLLIRGTERDLPHDQKASSSSSPKALAEISAYFTLDVCKQTLAVTGLLLAHGRDRLPLAAATLLAEIAAFVRPAYLQQQQQQPSASHGGSTAENDGVAVMNECVDQCALVIGSFAKRVRAGVRVTDDGKVGLAVSALGSLAQALPSDMKAKFLPSLMGLCVSALTLGVSNVGAAALSSLSRIIESGVSVSQCESAISILCRPQGENDLGNEDHAIMVVQACFRLIYALPVSTKTSQGAHAKCCDWFRRLLRQSDSSYRDAQLELLKALDLLLQKAIQEGGKEKEVSSEIPLLAREYVRSLGGAIVLLTQQFGHAGACAQELESPDPGAKSKGLLLVEQCIRVLILAHSFSGQALLGILIPVLVSLLDDEGKGDAPAHQFALPLVLNLAQSSPQAKQVLASLPASERSRLENGIRVKVQAEQAASAAAAEQERLKAERAKMPGEINFDAFE